TTRSLKAGEWYTFTMNFRSDRGLDIRNAVNATLEDDIDITSVGDLSVGSFRFKVNSDGPVILRFYQGNGLVIGGFTYIDWVKLTQGTVSTDWTPALEDTDAKI